MERPKRGYDLVPCVVKPTKLRGGVDLWSVTGRIRLNRVSESKASNTKLSELLGFHQVRGRELSECLSP